MRKVCLLLLVLIMPACSTVKSFNRHFVGEDNAEPPTPLTAFAQRLQVVELWSERVGEGVSKYYLKLTPALHENRIYIADSEGYLTSLDATSGQTVWRTDTNKPITGGPGAGAGLTLVGTKEGEVLAYSAADGKFLWQSKVSSEILAAPKAEEDIVVIRTIDGKIFGLRGETGEQLWTYDRTVPALTLRGTSAPIIDSGLVVIGFDGGKLAALDLLSGRLQWEVTVSQASGRSELDRMVDIDSEPIVVDGVIYVATFQGNLAAIELESGRPLWNREISSYAGLGVDNRYVYVTDDESVIWALDRTSGSSVWKQEQLKARAATAPASIGKHVVVGDLEGYLHWLDNESGEFSARHQISESRIIAPPIVDQDIVYSYSSNGKLGAFTYQ